MSNEPLTREQRIELLRTRTKKDGTKFATHVGPRKARKVSADGIAVALSVLETDEQKVKILQSFGADGRKALKSLIAERPELQDLYSAAYPRQGGNSTGRPFAPFVRATANGHAVVSGFPAGHAVNITRNEDGSVLLVPGDPVPGRASAEA